jgi:uncharacterized protein YigE (DUF2233 family)
MMAIARLVAAIFGLLLASSAARVEAEPCRSETFDGAPYTICSFDLRQSDLRIFWRNEAGEPYGSFATLATGLAREGLTLEFAMNGGMYDRALSPVGLYIENGRELKAANTADAAGNFHLKPNGVFYIDGDEAGVLETGKFLAHRPAAEFATQSGPMLVIDGDIHPRFIADSDSLKRRNGVGVSGPHEVHFAISESGVSFHAFARLFRDRLGCDNALFLDGTVSSLYAPGIGRHDAWHRFGPIIAVVRR